MASKPMFQGQRWSRKCWFIHCSTTWSSW